MFRLLDDEWTALYPQRSDYRQYRGSNYESEPFHGGKSILFSLPEASLENSMKNVDLQMHISKDISRYFEMNPSQNIGFVIVKLDNLFNGIINELKERKELAQFLHFHQREPISRSMKGGFSVLNENSEESGSHIDLYIRLSYFGKSIITEIVTPTTITKGFYAQEETNEKYPYQCRELKAEEIEADCWGSVTIIPPMKPQNLQCDCQTQSNVKLVQQKIHMSNNNMNVTNDQTKKKNDEDKIQIADKGISDNQNKIINHADISTKGDHKQNVKKKKKKKHSRSSGENNDEAEETGNVNKSKKIDKMEKSKKTNKISDTENNEKIENFNKTEKTKKIDNKEMLKKQNKAEKDDKSEKVEKRGIRDKIENVERTRKMDKKNRREKEKAFTQRKNDDDDEKSKETVKIGEIIETNRIDRKKYSMRRNEEKRENEGKIREKFNNTKITSIEADRIKMLRRRNAGPITVGIFEKNISSCLQITPHCSCFDCNQNSLSCPLENIYSIVPCRQEQVCRNNPILHCF
ncbi:uncharacterized protein LOC127277641 isoform X2 [Leptopilina boulardi]|nr:uncharacterized protein LOC127277641 isoform X2 [Leptopilina boulardi]